MRRLVTFVLVAAGTAIGLTWWLHDGDLPAALEATVGSPAEWDADLLLRDAGIEPDAR